jgi:hypothetical protein
MMTEQDEVYWANEPAEDLANEVMARVDQYDDYIEDSGLLDLWRACADVYYKGISESCLKQVGEQREFTRIFVNHTRNIIRHSYISTTATRPAWSPRAMNNDYESREQLETCEGVLDYYFIEEKAEKQINRATEYANVLGEGYVSIRWNEMKGDIAQIVPVMDPETGEKVGDRPVYEGDIEIKVHSPIDVIRDVTKETYSEQQWIVVREPANRWDLIAAYPQFREQLLAAPPKFEKWRKRRINPLPLSEWKKQANDDDIEIVTLYHNRTPAVPLGRVAIVLDGETVLSDKTMETAKYEDRPVYRIAASDVEGAPFGYTFTFDLLALQQLCNLLHSTISTNQSNFGVQCLQAMKGSGIETSEIVAGLRLILYDNPNGKLEPLQLAATPAEIFEYLKIIEGAMETLSGVNSVVRGNPEASLKSGNALALVQAQFSEFQRDSQQSYAALVEDTGTGVVRIFKSRADNPRLAAIVGKASRSHLRQTGGGDLSKIDRVRVDMGTYESRTPAGRSQLAQQLVQANMVETPEQYMAVLTTGRLEPVTHSRQATLDLIQAENEQLLVGQNPPVMVTDNHVLHISEHTVVGADTEARMKSEVMTALTGHLQAHIDALMTMSPQMAAMLKQPVLNQPPAPGAPGTPQPASGEGGTPPGGPPPMGGSQPGDEAAPGATPEEPETVGSAGVPFPDIAGTETQWQPGS